MVAAAAVFRFLGGSKHYRLAPSPQAPGAAIPSPSTQTPDRASYPSQTGRYPTLRPYKTVTTSVEIIRFLAAIEVDQVF